MSLVITDSNHLDSLDFSASLDISVIDPTLTIGQLSTGPNRQDCAWWYEFISPTGTFLHQGSLGTPDAPAGSNPAGFVTFALDPDAWIQPNDHIEWGLYRIILYAKGLTDAKTYSWEKGVTICAPRGNSGNADNNYGVAVIEKDIYCKEGKLMLQDNTNYAYRTVINPAVVSSAWVLKFPPDDQGNTPAADTANVAQAIFTLPYSAENYVAIYTSVRNYDLGDDVTLKIKYTGKSIFNVYCNINIEPLLCCYKDFVEEMESCGSSHCDYEQKSKKRDLLESKFMMLMMALKNPGGVSCVDPHGLIKEIQKIGGWSCDCMCGGGANVGIADQLPADLISSFVLNPGNQNTIPKYNPAGNNLVSTGIIQNGSVVYMPYLVMITDNAPSAHFTKRLHFGNNVIWPVLSVAADYIGGVQGNINQVYQMIMDWQAGTQNYNMRHRYGETLDPGMVEKVIHDAVQVSAVAPFVHLFKATGGAKLVASSADEATQSFIQHDKIETSGTIKTGAPNAGAAGEVKIGVYNAGAVGAATGYVILNINGTDYKFHVTT